MSNDDLIIKLSTELERLVKRVKSVAPYVRATLPYEATRACKHSGKWGEAHMGRSFSSKNQLNNLIADANKALEMTNELL
jgi:hypothetical protein